MPHDFDHIVVTTQEQFGSDDVDLDPFIETGPDSDEVWDILDLYWECRHKFAAEDVAPSYSQAWWQLDLGENLLFSGSDIVSNAEADSHRVIDGAWTTTQQTIEDEVNTLGAAEEMGEYDVHLAFSPGDLEIAFPGELSVRAGFNNPDAESIQALTKLSVHYRSSQRHQ